MEAETEQVYKNWMNSLAWWATIMYRAGKETGGEVFVRKVEAEFHQMGKRQGEILRSRLQVEEVDCTTIGRIMDGIDKSFGNYWDGYIENSPGGFEKLITTCPVADTLSRAPEICTRLLYACAQGIVIGINPDAKFRMDEIISKGDKVCHVRIELE
ncbi:MAG: hypothetical protein NTU41_11965 [Chloroflexi bacterium]|nr:hypothetical protein [Chloroflexota bacterium]